MAEVPRWLVTAIGELGVSEVRGGENPRILEYHATTSLRATEDEVSWCSSFCNWCLSRAGIRGTGSAAARSWLSWGDELKAPRLGCIVVLSRGTNPAQGHVGFFLDSGVLGVYLVNGNVGDRVAVSLFQHSRVLGYRWPRP